MVPEGSFFILFNIEAGSLFKLTGEGLHAEGKINKEAALWLCCSSPLAFPAAFYIIVSDTAAGFFHLKFHLPEIICHA